MAEAADELGYASGAAMIAPLLFVEAPVITSYSLGLYFLMDGSPSSKELLKSLIVGRLVGVGANKLGAATGVPAGKNIWSVNGAHLGAGLDAAVSIP